MKIATIVGARPQFIKAAVVSHKLRKIEKEILVHTGQHYDYNMSQRFFEELDIPDAEYNLGISGGTHSQMTGRMMIAIEDVLLKEKPDMVLLYGDTNSTLSAALAAAKIHIPVCHVEAGVRTHSKTNPEEINRVCTDHVSSLLLTSTEASLDNLCVEGLAENSFFVGDPMYDAFILYSGRLDIKDIKLHLIDTNECVYAPDRFYYLTCHREENTDDVKLTQIMKAMNELNEATVYPVHPRNRARAARIKAEHNLKKIILTEPVGYLESLALMKACRKVVTDSGGLQREAFFAGKQCVTILDFVCWQETMVDNRNQLSHANTSEILEKLEAEMSIDPGYQPFGDGHAAEKIVKLIEDRMIDINTGDKTC